MVPEVKLGFRHKRSGGYYISAYEAGNVASVITVWIDDHLKYYEVKHVKYNVNFLVLSECIKLIEKECIAK